MIDETYPTPQQKAIQLLTIKVWSESQYREVINTIKNILRGEDPEKLREKLYPGKTNEWFAMLLFECGEKQ